MNQTELELAAEALRKAQAALDAHMSVSEHDLRQARDDAQVYLLQVATSALPTREAAPTAEWNGAGPSWNAIPETE